MKESSLIEMRNKIETLGSVVQMMSAELRNLRDLSVGTLETLKRMDGYQEAIDKLANEYKDGKEKDASGTTTGDSGSFITDEQPSEVSDPKD